MCDMAEVWRVRGVVESFRGDQGLLVAWGGVVMYTARFTVPWRRLRAADVVEGQR